MQLTPATAARVARVFPHDPEVAELLVRGCGPDLPLVEPEDPGWEELVERVRFSVLKLSAGDRAELDRWIRVAHRDWRDVLVEAGFGDVRAHRAWEP